MSNTFRAIANTFAFPSQHLNGAGEPVQPSDGMTKRELFAAIAMHAEFLSCGTHQESAEALADAARIAGQSIEQRIAINALSVADALLAELAK